MSARRSCRLSPRSTRRRAPPTVAGPSVAGPSATGPSATGPSGTGPSAVGPSAIGFVPLQACLGETSGLHPEHLGVRPSGIDELVVSAELGDAPLVEDGDPLGPADGGEPMRDDHRGQARGELEEPV